MARLTIVQDWIPEHPYPEPVFLLMPFTPGINGLSKVVYQRQRESVHRASGEVWVIAKRAKVKQVSFSAPPPSRKQLKITAQNRKISLVFKKKVHILEEKKKQRSHINPTLKFNEQYYNIKGECKPVRTQMAGNPWPGQDSQASAMECTLINLTANTEEIMSAKKKRH